MNRFLTNEQAAYLSQLYTGTDAPKLHKAPAAYVQKLERKCAERGMTIHKLERKLSRTNRKHRALHRTMSALINLAYKSVIELGWPPTPSPAVEQSAYGTAWPRFADGAPVIIGDCVKGVMCDVHVASIVFRYNCVLLYDSQMFHYVKLDGGERAQRPDGTRLPLD